MQARFWSWVRKGLSDGTDAMVDMLDKTVADNIRNNTRSALLRCIREPPADVDAPETNEDVQAVYLKVLKHAPETCKPLFQTKVDCDAILGILSELLMRVCDDDEDDDDV